MFQSKISYYAKEILIKICRRWGFVKFLLSANLTLHPLFMILLQSRSCLDTNNILLVFHPFGSCHGPRRKHLPSIIKSK